MPILTFMTPSDHTAASSAPSAGRLAGCGTSSGRHDRPVLSARAWLRTVALAHSNDGIRRRPMTSQLNPYLNFNGNARQAFEFYASIFGGSPAFTTFADLGAADSPDANKIMHAMLETDAGYTLMGADTPAGMDFEPIAGSTVSISGDDAALRDYFDQLAGGGSVTMPLAKQAWGDEFGMCVDKFGVPWMVNIAQPG
jgi:PhnB protein